MADPLDNLQRVTVIGQRPTQSVGTFNISNFRSRIDSLGGVAKTSLFRVEIPVPFDIEHEGKINAETLSFLVASVNFPGMRITSHPIQRYGQGPSEDMPTGFVTGSCDMNIIGDADGYILRFFKDWMRGIVEFQSTQGGVETNKTISGMTPFHMNYKKNYETQITIVIYDQSGSQSYKVTLTKAFPVNLSDMYFSWSNTDQIMYIPIRFSFFDLAFQDAQSGFVPGAKSTPQAISLIEKIFSGGASIQAIGSVFNTQQNIGDVVNTINNTVAGIRGLGKIFGI